MKPTLFLSKTELKMWKRAVFFVAYNDEPNDLDIQSISSYLSTITIAETFSVPASIVAETILALRTLKGKQ